MHCKHSVMAALHVWHVDVAEWSSHGMNPAGVGDDVVGCGVGLNY